MAYKEMFYIVTWCVGPTCLERGWHPLLQSWFSLWFSGSGNNLLSAETGRKNRNQPVFCDIAVSYSFHGQPSLFRKSGAVEVPRAGPKLRTTDDKTSPLTPTRPGWWFQPLWKIWKSIGIIIPNIWENKTCSKPPTSLGLEVWASAFYLPGISKDFCIDRRFGDWHHSGRLRT